MMPAPSLFPSLFFLTLLSLTTALAFPKDGARLDSPTGLLPRDIFNREYWCNDCASDNTCVKLALLLPLAPFY